MMLCLFISEYSERGRNLQKCILRVISDFYFYLRLMMQSKERGKAENLGWNLREWLKCVALSHEIHIYNICKPPLYLLLQRVLMYISISSRSDAFQSTPNKNIYVSIIRNNHRRGRIWVGIGY